MANARRMAVGKDAKLENRNTAFILQASQSVQKVTNSIFRTQAAKRHRTVQDQKLAELADVIRSYRDVELDIVDTSAEKGRWVDGPYFDSTICLIILVNVVIIGLEMDIGDDNKKGYDRNPVWIVFEWLFLAIFFAEIAVKVAFHSWRWFTDDPWSWLAVLVFLLAFVDTVILMPQKLSGNLRMFSLIRCIQMFRLVKVIQHVKLLKELKQVFVGLSGSLVSLCWALGVLVLIVYVFSVWTTTLIGHNRDYETLEKFTNGWNNDEYFGNIPRSMFTLLQMLTLDTWSSSISRVVLLQEWYMICLIIPFLLLTTFGLMNVVVAVIIEQTCSAQKENSSKVKQREERNRTHDRETLAEVFVLANVEVSDTLHLDEFKKAAKSDPEIVWRLRQLELPPDEVCRLFQVMDGDGSRALSLKEFTDGCTKMKGNARSKDLLALQSQADVMAKRMDDLGRELQCSERMLAALDDCSRRMAIRFPHTVDNSRRQLAARTRGSAPTLPLHTEKKGMEGLNLGITNQPRLPKLPNLL